MNTSNRESPLSILFDYSNYLLSRIAAAFGKRSAQVRASSFTHYDMSAAWDDAFAQKGKGEYQRAIESFTRVMEIAPQLGPDTHCLRQFEVAESYFNRGECYSALGNYRLAVDDFDSAINIFELNPSDSHRVEAANKARSEAKEKLKQNS